MSASLPLQAPAPITDDPERCERILSIIGHALAAVEPEATTARAVDELMPNAGTVTVVAIGKAAPAMTRGAVSSIPSDRLGAVVAISDHVEPVPAGTALLIGSHPVPDRRSFSAGEYAVEIASAARDFVFFLISGGGSALAEVPAAGVDTEDLRALYTRMLRSGAPIGAMNTVRIHVSAIKGGGLAAALAPGVGHATVVQSDVGPDPALVASAPSIATATTPADAIDVLQRWAMWDDAGESVRRLLETAPPRRPPVPGPVRLVGDGTLAAEAAVAAARGSGIAARLVGTELAGLAAEQAEALVTSESDAVLVVAGETTVEVSGSGLGGRNQEAALAAAIALEGSNGVFAAFGTDGIDGPTDAAGAYVDGGTAARLRAAGVDPHAALADNDSHRALDAIGALIRTGPTGVNVADLWVFDPGT